MRNDSESKTWRELRSLTNPCPNVEFNEVDCAFKSDLCNDLDVKHLPSYLVMQKNKLIDVYYGQRTVEAMRGYCSSLLGFHVTRSLPTDTSVTNSPPEHNCPRLGISNFADDVKDGITLIM